MKSVWPLHRSLRAALLSLTVLGGAVHAEAPGAVTAPFEFRAQYTPVQKLAAERTLTAQWNLAWRSAGVDTGPVHASKRMVAYLDPNCPLYHAVWEQLLPLQDKVRIHWVLIGFVRPSSVALAATILDAPDPAAALAENEAHYDTEMQAGGLLPSFSPSPAHLAAVRRHTENWRRVFAKLPLQLDPSGADIRFILGVQSDATMRQLVGMITPWALPSHSLKGSHG